MFRITETIYNYQEGSSSTYTNVYETSAQALRKVRDYTKSLDKKYLIRKRHRRPSPGLEYFKETYHYPDGIAYSYTISQSLS